jgi:hypothetical protein
MTRAQTALLGVLGVQILLAAATWWPRGEATVEAHPLITIQPQDITRVVIERSGEGAKPLELLREEERWAIASSAGYPAIPAKVEALLETLTELQVRRPVATRTVNHDALHVGAEDWGKRVRLEAGAQSMELVLGAATGRATHVRLEGQDEVYTVQGLSEWSIQDRPASYWDAALLDLDEHAASTVLIEPREGPAIQLARGDGGWTFEGEAPAGQMIDPDKLDRLASAACTLRLREPVGPHALPEHGFDPPVARVTVTMEQDGASEWFSYALGNTVDGETYLQLPDNPFVVTVSEHSSKELVGASVEALLLGTDEG